MRCLNALRLVKTDDELRDYIGKLTAYGEELDFVLENNAGLYISVLVFHGEMGAAIEVALSEILSAPPPMIPHWHLVFDRPYYADISADPRVQKELQRWDKEETEYREAMRAFLDEQGY